MEPNLAAGQSPIQGEKCLIQFISEFWPNRFMNYAGEKRLSSVLWELTLPESQHIVPATANRTWPPTASQPTPEAGHALPSWPPRANLPRPFVPNGKSWDPLYKGILKSFFLHTHFTGIYLFIKRKTRTFLLSPRFPTVTTFITFLIKANSEEK